MSTHSKAIEPTITDMISLEIVRRFSVSPKGDKVAYTVQTPNWNKNFYFEECFIFDKKENTTYQLTRASVIKRIEWVNNNSIAILKSNPEDKESKAQVYLFENLIGEPWQVTDHKTGVSTFKPFAEGIIFLAKNPEKEENKERTEKFGKIVHFEQEGSANALYYVNFQKMKEYMRACLKSTEDETKKLVEPVLEISLLLPEALSISSFITAKQSNKLFLNCRLKDDLVYWYETSIYLITLDATKALETYIKRQLDKKDQNKEQEKDAKEKKEDYSYIGKILKVSLPKNTSIADISPDGQKVLINYQIRDNMFYTQSDIGLLDVSKVDLKDESLIQKVLNITANLDQIPMDVHWVDSGIFVSFVEGTKTKIIKLSERGTIQAIALDGLTPDISFQVSDNGHVAFSAFTNTKRAEVYLSKTPLKTEQNEFIQITNFHGKISNWSLGTVETIRWKSKDGTEIEGILRKPMNFDSKKK